MNRTFAECDANQTNQEALMAASWVGHSRREQQASPVKEAAMHCNGQGQCCGLLGGWETEARPILATALTQSWEWQRGCEERKVTSRCHLEPGKPKAEHGGPKLDAEQNRPLRAEAKYRLPLPQNTGLDNRLLSPRRRAQLQVAIRAKGEANT